MAVGEFKVFFLNMLGHSDTRSVLRGGVEWVFTRQAVLLKPARGLILRVTSAPPRSRASARSFPGQGPVSPHVF